MDVGGESEQPDEGDRHKAAVSDALKRAAVKFGVGRYLYRLPQMWVSYDTKAKKFTKTPTLPAWAMPRQLSATETMETTRVSTQQAKELQTAIRANGIDHTKLFERFDIKKLTDLAAVHHEAALQWCQDHKANGHSPVDRN